MKTVKTVIKKDKEFETTVHKNVKFVTFEKAFVVIQCKIKKFSYATKTVMSIEEEGKNYEES